MSLRDAHGPASLLDAIQAQVAHDGFMRVHRVDLRAASGLLLSLNQVLASDIRSLAALAVSEASTDTIFLFHLSDMSLSQDIQSFIRASHLGRSSSKGLGVVVLVACDNSPENFTGEYWDILDAVGLVGPLDGMAFAAIRLTEPDSLSVRIKASIAVEVGAWDLCLTERLLDLPMQSALRPDLCTGAWIDPQDADTAETLDSWGGEPAHHAAWLAKRDISSLKKRVWRGQLGIVFPWIEERRRDIIARYRPILRTTDRTMADVEMLDWGPLGIQLGNSAIGCPPAVHSARSIRNELAHGRPVSWPELCRCFEDFRILALQKP